MEEIDANTCYKQLVDLIDNQSLDDFIELYRKSIRILKTYDHIELILRATRFGLLPFVKCLLNDGADCIDVNCQYVSSGISPLVVAIRAQKHDLINYFILEAKADVNWSCPKKKLTCLHEAIRQCDLSTVTLLLEHGTIVDKRHLRAVIIECLSPRVTVMLILRLLL